VRVVIDTNVLISAVFWSGKPKQLLQEVRLGHFTFLTSHTLLRELREILTRSDKPFRLSGEEADRIVGMLGSLAELVSTTSRITVCADEPDNRVLECAVDGGADLIVTGDRELLKLRSFQGVKITGVAESFEH
jgi:putative PIN family toxin of toxin-antitoxin system